MKKLFFCMLVLSIIMVGGAFNDLEARRYNPSHQIPIVYFDAYNNNNHTGAQKLIPNQVNQQFWVDVKILNSNPSKDQRRLVGFYIIFEFDFKIVAFNDPDIPDRSKIFSDNFYDNLDSGHDTNIRNWLREQRINENDVEYVHCVNDFGSRKDSGTLVRLFFTNHKNSRIKHDLKFRTVHLIYDLGHQDEEYHYRSDEYPYRNNIYVFNSRFVSDLKPGDSNNDRARNQEDLLDLVHFMNHDGEYLRQEFFHYDQYRIDKYRHLDFNRDWKLNEFDVAKMLLIMDSGNVKNAVRFNFNQWCPIPAAPSKYNKKIILWADLKRQK